MRVAITGGTGFVGSHLAAALAAAGHEVVLLARGVDQRPRAREVAALPGVKVVEGGISDVEALRRAFAGCDAVAHCAGINREIGPQTYAVVHVRGTENVASAADAAGVRRLALVSFLRARPDSGSDYHDSKWAAEETVRASGLDWTVVKPGMMFGTGDHMLDHLSRALHTFPVYVGMGERRARPLAVQDAVKVLQAALVEGRLTRRTVALTGPTELRLDDAARMVARVIGKRRLFVVAPTFVHRMVATLAELVMVEPLIARAQVAMFEDGLVEAACAPDTLPPDLEPSTPFEEQSIRAGLPEPGGFGLRDLRLFSRRPRRSLWRS